MAFETDYFKIIARWDTEKQQEEIKKKTMCVVSN